MDAQRTKYKCLSCAINLWQELLNKKQPPVYTCIICCIANALTDLNTFQCQVKRFSVRHAFSVQSFSHCWSLTFKCWNNCIVLYCTVLHRHDPALLHHQALILDQLLTLLMEFSTLILKPSFSHQSFHP